MRDAREVITGSPYKPPRNLKPYQLEVECTDGDACKISCWCNTAQYGQARHSMGDHVRLDGTAHKHTQTVQPASNSSGYLERKTSGEIIYHAPWTKAHVPFRETSAGRNLTNKPRIETSIKAFERMRKECTAQVTASKEERCTRMVGQSACMGYRIVATNGHWALIEPGQGKNEHASPYIGEIKGHKASTLQDAELWNVLQCAEIMSDERSRTVALMMLEPNTVTVYAANSDVGEYIGTASGKTDTVWACSFDWKYLELVLGCWPLTVWVKDEESAAVFEPADKSWRFVLMPMRGELDAVKKIVRKAQAEMQAVRERENAPVWGGY